MLRNARSFGWETELIWSLTKYVFQLATDGCCVFYLHSLVSFIKGR